MMSHKFWQIFTMLAMADKNEIKWFSEPQKHDYRAAESYLNLILDDEAAKMVAE